MRVEIAHDPAAAVEEDERRQHPLSGTIEPHRNRLSHEITNDGEIGYGRPQHGARLAIETPRFRGWNLIECRNTEARQVIHDRTSLRIDDAHIQRRYQTIDAAPK